MKDRAETPLDGADPVLVMRMALAELAGEDHGNWPGPALSERLVELLEVRERLDAALLGLVGSWERDRAWEADGSVSGASWLEHRAPVAGREARRLVKTGRLIDRHREIAESLREGDTTAAHVDALAGVVSKDREPLLGDHAATLVNLAETMSLRDFATMVRRWAALADDQLDRDIVSRKWDRRHLHISETLDGWGVVSGRVDPAGRVTLTNVLDHLAPPDPNESPDGPRSLSQRRVDALVDLADWYLKGAKPGGNPPNLDVIVDVATLNGDTPDLAQLRCDLEGVGPVTRDTLHFLTCGATVTRVVTAGDSVILDMGRKVRLATPAQRRALAIRDRRCRFPSCTRQPQWCDVHHIAGWFTNNGRTDLTNLILLCRRHHTLVETTRWTITTTPTGDYEFTHPGRGP